MGINSGLKGLMTIDKVTTGYAAAVSTDPHQSTQQSLNALVVEPA